VGALAVEPGLQEGRRPDASLDHRPDAEMPQTDPKPNPQSAELLYLLAGDPAELAETLAHIRAADIAEMLDELPPDAAARVIGAMPYDLAVQVFDAPALEQRGEIFEHIHEDVAAPLIEGMSSDQQADLFRHLGERERNRLLPLLDADTREGLSMLLRYSADTAGGIMTTEFVQVPGEWTVEDTLRHIADVGRRKETVYAIYAVDEDGRLFHVVSLRELLVADRRLPIARVGDRRRPVTVPPDSDRDEVARLISRYDLLAIPVVDGEDRILGIVTVDDVIDAWIEATTEDVQKFGGMEALDEPYLDVGFMTMIRARGGWLLVLFLGELLTATAMAHFEESLARAIVLAMFIPLIIASGGNSGSQAATLVIRAMALGEVRLRDWPRVMRRELASGLFLGTMLAIIGMLRIVLWEAIGGVYGEYYLHIGVIVSVSLLGVVLFGTVTGSMLPFLLRRLGLDPAKASAPAVATLVDVTGILIYFGIASMVLRDVVL
jgi:magnesium transporter